jgi:glutamate-1-semialdehyde 2,1-aminomutase
MPGGVMAFVTAQRCGFRAPSKAPSGQMRDGREELSILEGMRTLDRSRQLQQRAERLLPGGVDSPVRAFRAVGGDPPFVIRAEGAYLWDADGNRYIDYFGSWGPMILGHAFPPVVEAIQQAAARSASFGASTSAEADLADLITAAVPSIEKLRFVSSGTEATMSAIRVARGFTWRKYIIKFEGCYHGHADGLLVKAGSGVATFGIPGSAGVPEEIAHFTLALPYNYLAAVEAAFAARPNEIAAVILEPVAGNMGCVPPEPGYLAALREITSREGAVLIFDEVMTGFRVAHGGAQQLYGVTPDMTCLGKIIGGGLPCGAFGGRAEIMDMLAPLGPVYQAGTLSGNPLAMAAGVATLGFLAANSEAVYGSLELASQTLAEGVAGVLADAGMPVTTNRVGAMWTWFFTNERVVDFATAATSDTARFGAFHRAMMDAGVWLPPSQFEAIFLGTAHTPEVIEATLVAARQAVASLHETQPAR